MTKPNVIVQLSKDAARSLTDEVKLDAQALWEKLVFLYEGHAHKVLGYSSWAAYCGDEFGWEHSQAYRMVEAGRVVRDLDSPMGDSRPTNERVARELSHLRYDVQKMKDAWMEAQVKFGDKPTANQVRDIVQSKNPNPPDLPTFEAEASKNGRKDNDSPMPTGDARSWTSEEIAAVAKKFGPPDQANPSFKPNNLREVAQPDTSSRPSFGVEQIGSDQIEAAVTELTEAWRLIRVAIQEACRREDELRFGAGLTDRLEGKLDAAREQCELAFRRKS